MMETRYKRAMAPLDAEAQARLWDRGGAVAGGGGSMELEEMVRSFYNDEAASGGEEEDKDRPASKWRRDLEAELKDAAAAEPVAEWIRAKAEVAVRSQLGFHQHGELLRRHLVRWLKELGLDAGICDSAWNYSAGIPSGSHEYIDVVVGNSRYIVEINLSEEFKIARPTTEYTELLDFLPKVFVGRPTTLAVLIRVMCLASQESIRSAGMHVPPWRRKKYMHEKWLGDYRRQIDSSSSSNLRGRPTIYKGQHAYCRANTLGTKVDCSKLDKDMFLRGI